MVTQARVKAFVLEHGLTWAEFVADMGDRPMYRASKVRTWLGY